MNADLTEMNAHFTVSFATWSTTFPNLQKSFILRMNNLFASLLLIVVAQARAERFGVFDPEVEATQLAHLAPQRDFIGVPILKSELDSDSKLH